MKMQESALKEVLMYAELYHDVGFSVIPLQAGKKQPLISWQEYQERIATLEEIHQWFERWKDANIGIVTGRVSNIIVLDIDGEEGWRVIRDNNFEIPMTWSVITGKGAHFYFKHPGGEIANFVKVLPGIDLKGDRGYVVAPPSIHPSGKTYQWNNDLKLEPANAPAWLLDLIHSKQVKDSFIKKDFKDDSSNNIHSYPVTTYVCIKDTLDESDHELNSVFKRFTELEKREDFLDFIFEIGIGEKAGKNMLCVLHQEEHPSAGVFRSNVSGRYLYRDFHTYRTYPVLDLLNEYYFNSNEKLEGVFKIAFAKYLIKAFLIEEETRKIYKLLRNRDENLAKTYFLIASLNADENLDQKFLSVRDLARVLKLSNITHANRLLNYLCLIGVFEKKAYGIGKAYGYIIKEISFDKLLSEIERTRNINIYRLSKNVAMEYFSKEKVKKIYRRRSSTGVKVKCN
jgi:hypothetical protein